MYNLISIYFMLFDLLQMNLISVVINHLSIEYEIDSQTYLGASY